MIWPRLSSHRFSSSRFSVRTAFFGALGTALLLVTLTALPLVGTEEGPVSLSSYEWAEDHAWLTDFEYDRRLSFAQRQEVVAYSMEMKVRHVRSLRERALPWVRPVPSANDDFVTGHSRGWEEEPEIFPQPIFGYTISAPDEDKEDRLRVVLVGSNHAREHPACWILHGMIEFLVSDDPRAEALRRNIVFYVYPVVNPDGKHYLESEAHRALMTVNGNPEVSEAGETNHNRLWHTDGRFASIDIVKTAIEKDTGGAPDYLLDFHGIPYLSYTFTNEAGARSPLGLALGRRGINMRPGSYAEGMLSTWSKSEDGLNATYPFTPEMANGPKENLLLRGKLFALAFHDVLTGEYRDAIAEPEMMEPVQPPPPPPATACFFESDPLSRENDIAASAHNISWAEEIRFDFPNNRSLALPEVDSYLDFGKGARFDSGEDLTVALWIKGNSTPGATRYIASRYRPGNDQRSWALAQRSDGEIIVTVSADGTHDRARIKRYLTALWPDSEIFDGRWRHLAFTFQGGQNGKIRIYLDGAELHWGRGIHIFDDSPVDSLFPAEAPFAIGALPGSRNSFAGMIDEIAVWNTALDPAEIRWLSLNSARGIDPAKLY